MIALGTAFTFLLGGLAASPATAEPSPIPGTPEESVPADNPGTEDPLDGVATEPAEPAPEAPAPADEAPAPTEVTPAEQPEDAPEPQEQSDIKTTGESDPAITTEGLLSAEELAALLLSKGELATVVATAPESITPSAVAASAGP
ncbi:MAG: hypothetical protein LBL01_03235, partial [Bifidobacteriaceae bacterium]|nr:hypothetical protein [Bifidobacteriaceae bacterium]